MHTSYAWTGLILSAVASAEAGGFAALDRDGSDEIGGEELIGAGFFARWDSNRDAVIALHEFPVAHRLLFDWDIDGDSRLSEIEFHNGLFKHVDADASGAVDRGEYDYRLAAWIEHSPKE
jgi:hypothetical protein